ncbi:MAG: hypothetical protein K940chlam1_00484 [Candidatus Anoxychlamydiales bacterium]|nr:hypothetical protein [Candidatus Anoxychlamydiales bacterium]NGX35833.1 hypothetical protein [Candidatus Anoxychlamydiales bacterium]
MSQTLSITDKTTYWPEISLAKEFVQEEKNTLKKITKIFFCIILSPLALFLDVSHNIGGFFKSKSINSKSKNDEKSFIERTKYIWANHKKALAFGSLAIGASIGFGYLYYSIQPFLDLNKEYKNCQKTALYQITHFQHQQDSILKKIQKQIGQTSIFDRNRLKKLAERSKRVTQRSQSEMNIAQPAANRALLNCKNNYNATFEKVKVGSSLLSLLFNFFKYDLD